ncbi:hypothetical protein [Rhizobium sp. WYJ-E13]|uniref:DUF4760 domain-containing protein n=1 Tax=unclassified Rhizobium TaxID=2613769 RepID=UPI001C1EA931|nr:hypothetical protein [Rhizobium sp. WYJ-E13]QWW69810.1 hypothetical protein KQ933_08955 [Rhizobium sp. WYJ-E13]
MSVQPAGRKPNRFLWVRAESWEIWSQAVTTAGILIALVGAGWVIFEYYNNAADERNRYTFRLIDSWEREEYKKSYWELRERYTGFLVQLPKERIETAETDEKARREVIEKFNASLESNDEAKRQIRDVAYFFNKLNLCLDADLCSDETATIFFNDTVKSFLEVFRPHLEANQRDMPGGLPALEALSARLN